MSDRGMLEITSRQRRYLRGKAHSLHALVQVGRAGFSDAVAEQIDAELDRHELIKVRLDAEREERGALAERIAGATGAAIAGEIGRIVILYRPAADAEKRRFSLPE